MTYSWEEIIKADPKVHLNSTRVAMTGNWCDSDHRGDSTDTGRHPISDGACHGMTSSHEENGYHGDADLHDLADVFVRDHL